MYETSDYEDEGLRAQSRAKHIVSKCLWMLPYKALLMHLYSYWQHPS